MSSTRFDFDSFNELIANNKWSRKSVSLFHLNARSLRNKGEQLDVYFEQLSLKFDFLCFTETWYADASDVYLFDGYSHVGLFRAEKRGGGVSVYAKAGLKCDLIDEYSAITSDFEVITIRCCSVCIVLMCRPPSGKVERFLDYLDKTLAHVSSSRLCAILVGDVNIDLLTRSNAQCEFCSTVYCYDFQNLVNCATRVTATS